MRPGVCMLGKLPFRSKLILVVSVPLFALVGFAGVTIHSRFDALSNQQQYGRVLPAFDALTQLGRAAADEGVAAQWFIQARQGDPPASKALIFDTRSATDDATHAVQRSYPALVGLESNQTLASVRAVLHRLSQLINVAREQVNAHTSPGPAFSDLAASAVGLRDDRPRRPRPRPLDRAPRRRQPPPGPARRGQRSVDHHQLPPLRPR
jgi:hypothetical protein